MAEARIRVRAVDETKAAFASVEANLRRLGGAADVLKGAFAGVGGVLSIGGLVSLARDIGRAVTEAEQSQARLNAVLRTTQNTVGLARAEVEGLIRDLAGRTLFDDEALRNATAVLATFKNVAGDTFKTAISLATDLSGLLGGDLNSAVLQLGKALEDPTRGITALRRAGVSFTQAQEQLIEDLAESNRLLDAQKIVLEAVAGQVSGVAEEMNTGLVGATTAAGKAWDDLLESIGQADAVLGPVIAVFDAITLALKRLEAAVRGFDDTTKNSILFRARGGNLGAGVGGAVGDFAGFSEEQVKALREAGKALSSTQLARPPVTDKDAERLAADAIKRAQQTAKELDEYIKNLRDTSAREDLELAVRYADERTEGERRAAEEQKRIEEDLDEYIKNLRKETTEESIAAQERLSEQTARRVAEEADAAQRNARELGLIFESAFEDAVLAGKELQDVIKGLSQDIARVVLRRTVTEPVAGLVSDALRGILGGARAAGGPVAAGSGYLVGERGPEFFVPKSNGTIIPNGAGGIQIGPITVNAPGSTPGSEARIAAAVEVAAQRGAALVAERKRRGYAT